ncbi:hypothetical protein EI77_00160 [Prosthecobacter fusiformis]|uniref:Uncharacterized protein n=1 Tax=Prosthecobacter fusiformis TaxID=48464 RepID=A0A4R7SNU7_9BACT|nr:hypothetical protein EI77_00160 [Prosthecobacter fusiformis]
MATPDTHKRLFHAIVWRHEPDQVGERVTTYAEDVMAAKRLLEEKYGKGCVFDLHNASDAEKPR